MIRTLSLATVLAVALALPAIAQEANKAVEPGTASPSTVEQKSDASFPLTETEAKTWTDKPIYSSDGKNIGEVVEFQRDSQNNVAGMHADIGGFMGFGQTRVNLTTAQFKLKGDRVMLDMTADQVKALPKVAI